MGKNESLKSDPNPKSISSSTPKAITGPSHSKSKKEQISDALQNDNATEALAKAIKSLLNKEK